jgi:CPA2 family monovalent cation:H+ antiporter-2
MHSFPLITDLVVILGAAGLVSLLFHRIRQPVVLGYIVAGIIVGPYTPPFPLVSDIPGIKMWAELGVIFLMFSLGLEFSFRKLLAVGIPAGVTAGFEVIFMLALGYATGKLLGWSDIDSIFLGAMLSISSTTIIIKALDELKLKTRRFAELIFGVLIVEDLIAILILVALSTVVSSQNFSGLSLLGTALKLVLVVGSWFLSGYFIVPGFVKYVGRVGTNEMLTLISLSLCLALAVFASYFHYSVALGAFIMGSILAESSESHKIVERIEPLRDMFAAVFFVSVGMLIDPKALWANIGTVLIITLVTIVGKVLSTTLGSLISGQTVKSSIQVGFGLAQIGEFSFIIAGLGLTSGETSDFLYPIGVAVSLITTFTTPYMIRASEGLASRLESKIPLPLKRLLVQYTLWIQERQTDAAQKKAFYQLVAKWLVNGIVVSVIFILSAEFSLPLLRAKLSDSLWSTALSWFLTVIVTAPFIWGMLSTFQKSNSQIQSPKMSQTGVLLVFRFITFIWLGALSRAFWPFRYTVLLIVGIELIFLAVAYKQIEKYYRWFEDRFLSTFKNHEKPKLDQNGQHEFGNLAPWDAHLVRLKVHPNAGLVLKTLLESKLRDQYGINVVIIQRGDQLIVAPKRDEKILPQDELLVLSTDEQLELIRPMIEKPQALDDRNKHIAYFDLNQIRLLPDSSLIGKTIRTSGIREEYEALVVGIERNGERIMNPESNLPLQSGDVLWIVGDREHLLRLNHNLD